MKLEHIYFTLIATIVMSCFPAFAQMRNHSGDHGGYFNPDSLTQVTVTGTAIVDSSMIQPMYYLDEDGDSQADYHLNFGPHWYQPNSTAETRPADGDLITITGGQHDSSMFVYPTIVVYEINGVFWRDPYNPFWTNMGEHSHGGGHHQGGCTGFAFGRMQDTVQTISVNGTALADTTFIMEHYYLDVDGDSLPDYFLNFGPPWYEPTSGTVRPDHGETVSILGGLRGDSTFSVIVVYEINGQVWHDSTQTGRHFGGGWMHRNMSDSVRIHDPFDLDDWMQVNPGWHQGGGHHHDGMIPDSLFGRMLQLYPQNIPHGSDQHIFAGYEVGMFSGSGSNMMWRDSKCGGHMNFGSDANFQLHYNDIQLLGFNIDENTINAKYWDDTSNDWVTLTGAVVDAANNTVTFSGAEISNFIILTGEQATDIDSVSSAALTYGFVLEQNYPNPFNPSTTIEFNLNKNSQIALTIYNILGQKIITLINQPLAAGFHSIRFEGNTLSSGTYFYELKVDDQRKIMKMELVR